MTINISIACLESKNKALAARVRLLIGLVVGLYVVIFIVRSATRGEIAVNTPVIAQA